MADGYSISAEQEAITVNTTGHHVADPKWRHKDASGHVHAFEGNELPTLRWVVTETYWCRDCGDEHEEGEWRCVECGAVVVPHYNHTGPRTSSLPGRTSYTLTLADGRSVEVTEEEAYAIRDNGESAAEAVVKAYEERGMLPRYIVFGDEP